MSNVVALFVIGCVRQINPLPLPSYEVFSTYFTADAWEKLLQAYYPIKKCTALNKRGTKFNLPPFLPSTSNGRYKDASTAKVDVLATNLWLHRQLLILEEAPPHATQFGYANLR